jgi:hypothetical protein
MVRCRMHTIRQTWKLCITGCKVKILYAAHTRRNEKSFALWAERLFRFSAQLFRSVLRMENPFWIPLCRAYCCDDMPSVVIYEYQWDAS